MSIKTLGDVAATRLSTNSTKNRAVATERPFEVLGRWMDNQFQIPLLGWRFGLNAIIDLVPGVGDTATSLVAIYIMGSAVRYRVPKITLLRMGINIAIYFLVGLIPWVGDLFDAWWKPNIRNLSLLRRSATVSDADAGSGRPSDWIFVGAITLFLLALLVGSLTLTFYILSLIAHNFSL